MTLRERIKTLCKEKKISVNKLEIDCGFAKGYISKLDKSVPGSEKLQKIADYLNVSLDYLMNGKKGRPNCPDEAAQLIDTIKKDIELSNALSEYFELPDIQKKHIIELIHLFHDV